MERPLFWHQGLFLQPQHFQLEDLYSQSLLETLPRHMAPHLWGVGELQVEEAALGNLSFSLKKGDFLFPGVIETTFPGNALIEPRSFDEAWVEGGKPFTVYLGLRKWNDQGANVTVLSGLDNLSEVNTRFATKEDPEEISDLHQDGPRAQVKRMYFVPRLFWGTELDQLGNFDLIPLAQLVRTGEKIELSKQFIPPCLTISGSAPLLAIIREIRDQIASRGRQLESYKRERGVHTAEFGARDMVYLLALRSLNRYIPFLFHLTESRQVHPWTVFGVLRQLIGELSSFSERINVLGELEDGEALLPSYNHRDLWRCFSSALAAATRLLDEITAGPEYMFQLLYDGTYYASELAPAIFEGGGRFHLVLETGEDPDAICQSLDVSAKLSSREALPILIARALPGVRLIHLPTPPKELPRRANSIYFRIDHHGGHWSDVQKGKNIALYWDGAPDDLKVELMVVEKGSQ